MANEGSRSGLVALTVILMNLFDKLTMVSIKKKPDLSASWQWKKNFNSVPCYPEAMQIILFCLNRPSTLWTVAW